METKSPNTWSALLSDCCSASGITCLSQRVTEISWGFMGLNGTINGTAIPSSVTYLYFHSNLLTGQIPSSLPSGLLQLKLYNNKLNGSIPSHLPAGLVMLDLEKYAISGPIPDQLPKSLGTLYLHGNRMTGDLPSFPSTIRYFALKSGNRFSGSLRLSRPLQVWINDNWITDVFINDSSVLTDCDLSNNPLLGSFNIVNLTMCNKNGLYSASLLPVTKKTQMATSMMTLETITTLETTMETNTIVKKTSGKIQTKGTVITTLRLESISLVGTVSFVQVSKRLSFSLFMILRLLISVIVTSFVLKKSPYLREFKTMMKKMKGKRTSEYEL